MVGLSRWCMAHRRVVVVSWLAIAVLVNVIAAGVGRQYANNFTLPGTQAQRVTDLLSREFPSQSGDVDQVVFRTTSAGTTIDSPSVKRVIAPLIAGVAQDPHVVAVVSPYGPHGGIEISKDRRTAFVTIDYSERANLLPDDTGTPVLNAANRLNGHDGLKAAAGGQVIEQAEGFSVGPATVVGVIAALVILLLTFGSLAAAGLPLLTAGLGLITGTALIGLATHVLSMSNVSPELALMIGLGVGVDYALFIVTRFREAHARLGDVAAAVSEAMDTSGRAILLAGSTVIIALLGMFATGVSFLYGLSIASVLSVLLVMTASLTLLPALLSRFGNRIVRASRSERRRTARGEAPRASAWRRWSVAVQRRPKTLALASFLVMAVCVVPFFSLRLDQSDAGNDPSGTSTQRAFTLLADGFGAGFNGPLLVAVTLPRPSEAAAALPKIAAAVTATPDIGAVSQPRLSSDGRVAVLEAYPRSAPQAVATPTLDNHLRSGIFPPLRRQLGAGILVGGFTAGSIDFSHVLARKLPIFIGLVVILSALLLFVMFRSLLIPLQAAVMNLLSIGGALGATVALFQWGWLSGLIGVTQGPIEPWIPVLMFAVVFGLSMDYEVFLVSRVREEWLRTGDASEAVANGIAFTGRVITAAAAIMVCVFLSFMLGDERPIKEFGFGLASAVFLDALVVRCVLLPSVLELLGPSLWKLPPWLDEKLPHINIEGHGARADGESDPDAVRTRVGIPV